MNGKNIFRCAILLQSAAPSDAFGPARKLVVLASVCRELSIVLYLFCQRQTFHRSRSVFKFVYLCLPSFVLQCLKLLFKCGLASKNSEEIEDDYICAVGALENRSFFHTKIWNGQPKFVSRLCTTKRKKLARRMR